MHESPLVAILLHLMIKINLNEDNLVGSLGISDDPVQVFLGAYPAVRVVIFAKQKQNLNGV